MDTPAAPAEQLGQASTDASAADGAAAPLDLEAEELVGIMTASVAAGRCDVVLVRHGERLDEAPDARIVNDRPWWDPPLTTNGHAQARAAGKLLLAEHERAPFDAVYASPTCRTVQTAGGLCAELGLPLVLVPGLAECAAAVSKLELRSFDPASKSRRGKTPPRFLTLADAVRYVPAGTRIVQEAPSPRSAAYSEDFLSCVTRLARERRGSRLLACTHREGIADLQDVSICTKPKRRAKYCAAARFSYEEAAEGPWTLVTPPTNDPLPPVE